jgi:hypothetical protein
MQAAQTNVIMFLPQGAILNKRNERWEALKKEVLNTSDALNDQKLFKADSDN